MTPPARIRLGVIGCGAIARNVHLPTLKATDEFEISAIAEADPGHRSRALQLAPGARASEDYRALLGDPGIDAVLIALPTHLHAEAGLAALHAGRHVYLEKPVGIDAAELARLEAVATDRVVMTGFNYRYHPLLRQLRHLVASGAIGRVVAVESTFTTPARDIPEWKRARRSGGGVLLDFASHHIDLAAFVLGQPVARVSAEIRSIRSEADVATLHMGMADGTPVQSLFSFVAGVRDAWTVHGERGVLTVDRNYSFGVAQEPAVAESRPRMALRMLGQALRGPLLRERITAPGRDPSFALAIRDFAAAIRGAPNPDRPLLADGCRSLAVVLAAEASAAAGRVVELAPRPE